MKKILFIDDEKDTVKPLIDQLESYHNFKVTIIQDYRKINKELSNKYDAIILDIMMPLFEDDQYFTEEERQKTNNGRKTGIIIFDKIRLRFPQLPIIFYSAIKERIHCDACTVIVNKPELAKSLAKTIEDLIEKSLSI